MNKMKNKARILLIKKASKNMIKELQDLYLQFAVNGIEHAAKKPITPFRVYKCSGLFVMDERYFNMQIKFQLLPVHEITLQTIEEIDEDTFYQGIKSEKADPTTETEYKTFNTDGEK